MWWGERERDFRSCLLMNSEHEIGKLQKLYCAQLYLTDPLCLTDTLTDPK